MGKGESMPKIFSLLIEVFDKQDRTTLLWDLQGETGFVARPF